MHISEGVLSPAVLVAGGLITAAGVAQGVRQLRQEEVPKSAVLTSAFFVASFIHIPVGVASVHLVLNGLMGLFLGWAAFPCLLVALALQGVIFQFGGITTLGVNTFNMAAPAILSFYLFGRMARSEKREISFTGGFLCGFVSVFGGALLIALSLYLAGEEFFSAASLVLLSHIPVMVVEGVITGMTVVFVKRIRPEIFEVYSEGAG